MKAEQSGDLSAEKPLVKNFQSDEFDQKAIFLCQFCGGTSCDQQNYLKNKIQPNAIRGLHSNWITDNILAMQRPSQRLIKQFGLYAKFKQIGVRTILNLQQPGEHPYCGDGIIPNIGFSYIPQNFFQHGIHVFNESWEDMTATTFSHMMKIMNIFQMSLEDGGKIAVHCHAGRGRTLLVICSWLIYFNRMTAQDTIKLAVEKRQGVLTRSSQRDFLKEFQHQCKKRWISFGVIKENGGSFTQFVQWQTLALLNKDKKKLNFTPFVHSVVLQNLKKRLPIQNQQKIHALINPSHVIFPPWSQSVSQRVSFLKKELNNLRSSSISQNEPLPVLASLLHDFYESLPFTILTSLSIESLKDHLQKHSKEEAKTPVLNALLEPQVLHIVGVCSLAVILDFCLFIKKIIKFQENKIESNEQKEKEIQKQEKQKTNIELKQIIQCLCDRISLLLTSKKKYFPSLFPNQRTCILLQKHAKLKKYTNAHVVFISDILMRLSSQIPEEEQSIQKIILNARKIDSNLHYLTKVVRQGNKVYYNQEQTKKLYHEARLN